MKPAITSRQLEVMCFLAKYLRENGVPPSFEDVMAHFGFRSKNAVTRLYRALERKGLIRREYMRCRAIQLAGVRPVQQPAKHGGLANRAKRARRLAAESGR